MIALDANVLIYFIEGSPQFGTAATTILQQVAGEHGCVSSLIFAEFEAGRQAATKTPSTHYLDDFIDGLVSTNTLTVVDLTRRLASQAGRLRRDNPSLSLADAIHLASAQEAGARVFYTNDRQLTKLGSIHRLPIKSLDQA